MTTMGRYITVRELNQAERRRPRWAVAPTAASSC